MTMGSQSFCLLSLCQVLTWWPHSFMHFTRIRQGPRSLKGTRKFEEREKSLKSREWVSWSMLVSKWVNTEKRVFYSHHQTFRIRVSVIEETFYNVGSWSRNQVSNEWQSPHWGIRTKYIPAHLLKHKWQKNASGFWCLSPVPLHRTHSASLDFCILEPAQFFSALDLHVCCPYTWNVFPPSRSLPSEPSGCSLICATWSEQSTSCNYFLFACSSSPWWKAYSFPSTTDWMT